MAKEPDVLGSESITGFVPPGKPATSGNAGAPATTAPKPKKSTSPRPSGPTMPTLPKSSKSTSPRPSGPTSPTIPAPKPTPPAKTTTGTTAKAIIDALLKQYGLTSLTTWAWKELTSGVGVTEIKLLMYTTPQFKARFPGMTLRKKNGYPPISPATYIAYQTQMAQLAKQYNLPKGFLTTPTRIGQLIGTDISAAEIEARVQQGYAVVSTAPASVRQAFAAWFGAGGTGALASYFLTPKASTPILEQQAQAAEFGGISSQASVNLTKTQAMQLAQMGISTSAVESGVAQLAQEAPLFAGTIEGKGPSQAEGIEAEFGLEGSARAISAMERAESTLEERFKGGGGAAIETTGSELGKAKAF